MTVQDATIHQLNPATTADHRAAVQAALSVLAARIDQHAPNMVLTSSYIPPTAVSCSYLLNRLLSVGLDSPTEWRSVFTNSGLESLSLVLKFAKNRNNRLLDGRREHIVILDQTDNARHALGLSVPALHAGGRGNVTVCNDIDEFISLGGAVGSTMIVIGDGMDASELEAVLARLRAAAERDALIAVGILHDYTLLSRLRHFAQPADMVFLGEVLTRGVVPVGSVSFREHIFKLWSNPVDSIAHISTFGCNGLAMDLARHTLESQRGVQNYYDRLAVDAIMSKHRVKSARQRLHSNPWQARAIELAGLNFRFRSAAGVIYECADGSYVDLGSGAGTAFRGHNQIAHLPTVDELGGATELLEAELDDLTGLGTMLPAVSGATSVDKAVLAALGARPGKPVVVTAAGNFSGKGALSVALSRTSSFFRDRDTDAFAPHHFQIIECPLDDHQAWQEALTRDDVALVWMEPALGVDCAPIPRTILDLIAEHRDRGYLVGFDECFTGYWRGDNDSFLMSSGLGVKADIVALAKSMSDGLVPVGAALLADHVYDDLRTHASDLADWLRDTYTSDFTAHFALNALRHGRRAAADNSTLIAALDDCLRAAEASPVFDRSARVGLLGRFTLTDKLWWLTQNHTVKEYLEAVVSKRIADRCRAITLQMRVVPSTAGTDHQSIKDALDEIGSYLATFTFADLVHGIARSLLGSAAREIGITVTQQRLRRADAALLHTR